MITLIGQSGTAGAHHLALAANLWENQGLTSVCITPLIDRSDEIGGFESTRHTTLKHYLEAGYQAIVAMLPQKAQSKCSVLLIEAELHRSVPNTCEERCLHSNRGLHTRKKEMRVNACVLSASGYCRGERKKNTCKQVRQMHHMNNPPLLR